MFNVYTKNTRTTSSTYLTVFIVNFEHISHIFLSVSIIAFEQVNGSWVTMPKKNHLTFPKNSNKNKLSLENVQVR